MALVGDLKDLALVDIIQINCVGRNTARLTVHYPIGDGVFYFAEGDVVDARLGSLVGVEAVYKALAYEQGSFRIDTGIPAPTRTIFEPWANLIMEGLRLLDEARAGIVPEIAIPPTPPTPTTLSGAMRTVNVYQALVSDLTKIKGLDAALAVSRDGVIQAVGNIKAPEKVAAMAALMTHLARLSAIPGRVGVFSRLTISAGPRKMMIFDLENCLTVIEFGAAIRFETISPHIDRILRKTQARLTGAEGAGTGMLGGTGSLTPAPFSGPLTM
jgi:hypothetical protein